MFCKVYLLCTISWLPWWLASKESAFNAENTKDAGWIPEYGRSPGGGNGNPLQDSCLENPMDRGTWQAAVQKVYKKSDATEQISTQHTHRVQHDHFNRKLRHCNF